jgi:DNA-binding HxlR family transcriptional regulator
MSGYGQFCPVAQALDLVGERWTLLVVRELLCGDYRFNELLHGLPLISKSLLSQRLKMLEEVGIVEKKSREGAGGHAYALTPAGRELEPVVMGLGIWGKRWVRRKLRADELDPVLLMWDLRRRVDATRLPQKATVVMFWFRDLPARKSRYWLRAERPELELCLTNPGLEVELAVETTIRTMAEVWMGERPIQAALAEGAIELKGAPKLARALPGWLLLSSFAGVDVPATA